MGQEQLFRSHEKAKRRWNMERIFLSGNHENRLARCCESDSSLVGTLSLKMCRVHEVYDVVGDYTGSTPSIVNRGDVNFAHFAISGTMCRPLSSQVNLGSQLLNKMHSSFVVGHSHIFSHAVQTISGPVNKQIHGLSAGCMISEKDNHAWAGTSQALWVRGAALLHRVQNGAFDLEWWSLPRIRETFR